MSIPYFSDHNTLDDVIQKLTSLRDELAEQGLTDVKVAQWEGSLDVFDNVEPEIRTVHEVKNYNGTGYDRVELETIHNADAQWDNTETIVFFSS